MNGKLVLAALTLAATFSLASPTVAQTVEVTVSSRAGDRLAARPSLHFVPAGGTADFRVSDERRRQTMIGFGASFNEAGMLSLNALDRATQEQMLTALFNRDRGAGLSAMKTVIGATDFASAGPFYSYDDTPGDVGLAHFSIARDLGPNGLITYIRRARAHGDFALQATMDYPPDWMLVDATSNQAVRPELYPVLARYYLRYLQAYEAQGIRIDYLSPFNEPSNYTKIGYEQIRDFVRDQLGPLLARSGLKTVIQVSEAQFRTLAARLLQIILNDPGARRYVGAVSYHGYDYLFDRFPESLTDEAIGRAVRKTAPLAENGYTGAEQDQIGELAKAYPDIKLWMTEICYFDMADHAMPWLPSLPRADFADGEFWGLQIANEVLAGASGWTYWNMILDEAGGPALASPAHGDPAHNVQQPVVIVDRARKMPIYTGLYYYLAQFSRFVRPGSVLLDSAGAVPRVRFASFLRPDGRHVSVAINASDAPRRVVVGWEGRQLEAALDAHSITTLTW